MILEKFKENNKSWLDKTTLGGENKLSLSYLSGHTKPNGLSVGVEIYLDENYKYGLEAVCLRSYYPRNDKDLVIFSCTDIILNNLESYFNDWCKPTQDELNYFEMVEGYRLPWSEEHPLILQE